VSETVGINLKKIFAKALDPIHIGAGGYKLGRVDNTIVREPATDLPKIPGTAIAGVTRYFAEIINENNSEKIDIEKIFGTEEQKGKLHFYDGQIILFPVYSSVGTIWITTKDLFKYWFKDDKNEEDKLKFLDEIEKEDKAYAIKGIKQENKTLNLGWILIEVETKYSDVKLTIPDELNKFVKRIVVVPEKLFSTLVNDNLEVRTSVKIDKTTGTAADGGLFTYEAIPRGTIIGFEIGYDMKNEEIAKLKEEMVEKIKLYFKLLGIGGMGTRGFGRLEIIEKQKGDSNDKS